jgi:hypothetical protein
LPKLRIASSPGIEGGPPAGETQEDRR